MPPKQTKKQTTDKLADKPSDKLADKLVDDSIETIQKEWASNVSEIINMREKLSILEKRNEDLVSKLWEKMNKTPSEQIVIESTPKIEEEKKPKEPKEIKVKKVEPKEPDSDEEEEEVKPKTKVATKKAKPEVEKPKEEKKKLVKKVEPVKEEPKKAPVKGKITAPSKGTPKPKATDSDDEKPKKVIVEDSSSDTEVDSLSSVSSESDASGGEDD
jgi:hypothetical protein